MFTRKKEYLAALRWVAKGDVGISSKTILAVMIGEEADKTYVWHNYPLDAPDFNRCYNLLKAVPSWRKRLPEVAKKYPKWAPLVENWDRLEKIHEENSGNYWYDALTSEMRRIMQGGR